MEYLTRTTIALIPTMQTNWMLTTMVLEMTAIQMQTMTEFQTLRITAHSLQTRSRWTTTMMEQAMLASETMMETGCLMSLTPVQGTPRLIQQVSPVFSAATQLADFRAIHPIAMGENTWGQASFIFYIHIPWSKHISCYFINTKLTKTSPLACPTMGVSQ